MPASETAPAERLTLEALFGSTSLLGEAPVQIKLSPDGQAATYLRAAPEDRERLELMFVDWNGGKRRLADGMPAADAAAETDAEKAERERRRAFAAGVTAHAWHPDGKRVLYVVGGEGYLVSVDGGDARRLTPPGTRQTGLKLSPMGTFAAYVRDGDLYIADVASGAERRLTEDAGETVGNGVAEFVAQEEMHRFDGFWWSADERRIAYQRVDAAPIPVTHRHEIQAGRIDVVAQRYPFSGAANAEVSIRVLELASGRSETLDWRIADDDYLARAQFAPGGAFYVQAQSRDQRRLAVRRYADGAWRDVLTETSETWINLHDNLRFLGAGAGGECERLLWTSERTGSSQLFVHDGEGGERLLDTGLGRVNRVLDATGERAWVTGWRDDPTEQDIFEVELASGACRSLTGGGAWHDGVVGARNGIMVATRSDADTPMLARAVDLRGERPARMIAGGAVEAGHPYFPYLGMHAAARISRLDGGPETFWYRLTRPVAFEEGRRYPVIVHVYGGPGAQRVRRDFAPLSTQLFAQAGFGVFELDNRGASNREKAFEDAIHERMGEVEVQDQLAGVDFLRSLPWVDAERIAIYGHSYGGFMVLKCLARSSAFAAGVSVAPVSRWELYDTHYTERYMGTPQSNPEGYRSSAVLGEAGNIRAPLLLMHGMADDNVLFAHATELMHAMQSAGVAFDLMTYPGAKHALQERPVAIHRHRHILAFLQRTIGDAA